MSSLFETISNRSNWKENDGSFILSSCNMVFVNSYVIYLQNKLEFQGIMVAEQLALLTSMQKSHIQIAGDPIKFSLMGLNHFDINVD